MSGENSDEEYEFIMGWNIENYLYCWQRYGEELHSPLFTATSMKNTKWRLSLNPVGDTKKNYIGCYLNREEDDGPESIEVYYVLEILGIDGSVLGKKNEGKHEFIIDEYMGDSSFVEWTRVLQFEKNNFSPLNTLTVCCKMRRCENRSKECMQMFAKTVINVEKMSSIWDIKQFSSLKLEQRIPFVMKSMSKEVLMKLNLFLCEGRRSDEIIFIDFDCVNKKMKYFYFKVFLIADGGNKIDCNQRDFWCKENEKNWMFSLRLTKMDLLGKKDLYLKDDILSLYCECVFPTVISFEGIVSTKFEVIIPLSVPKVNIIGKQSDNARSLIEDFKTLYTDGTLSDIKLSTETKSFPVHAAVLCARSPVFKAMFSDDMKEKIKGSVDIIDLDDDTICRMLLYLYTDRLEDLQWESALRLYEAADKRMGNVIRKPLEISCGDNAQSVEKIRGQSSKITQITMLPKQRHLKHLFQGDFQLDETLLQKILHNSTLNCYDLLVFFLIF
ncbi:TD and POZ domain-containing protein 1 [Trichonephila clavata]|uniref:TD and POZ domain-containing protein 1 n=1 Tax=Trichonephila clavata TaxID=2740835 RepID=A0A8X6EY06_TRICU|nr:TD and POZ domain-containing protein 1 [Trichonephila clavata]